MNYDVCLSCDCTSETGCRLEIPGPSKKRPYIMKTPRTKRGPYQLSEKRSAEREQSRRIKLAIHNAK